MSRRTSCPRTCVNRSGAGRLVGVDLSKGTCAVDGCERTEVAKGYCRGHYGRWKKFGDPGKATFRSAGDRSRMVKHFGQACSLDGCDRVAVTRGLCRPHYARLHKHGDVGTAAIRNKPPDGTHGPVCSVDGCVHPEGSGGMCGTHYARWRINGDHGPAEIRPARYGDGVTCSVAACDRRPKANGLCDAHRQRATKGLLLDTPILYVNRTGALCTFGGCLNKAEGRHYRPRHKAQLKAGQPLVPLREVVAPTFRDELGRKRCATCLSWLPESAFYTSKTTRDGLHPGCRRCQRNRGFMKRFGITVEHYEKLLAAQGGVCWICKKTPEINKKLLAVDHDHECCPTEITCGKCIRGLLCSCCNMIIGMIGDKPLTIVNMATYLHMNEGRLL